GPIGENSSAGHPTFPGSGRGTSLPFHRPAGDAHIETAPEFAPPTWRYSLQSKRLSRDAPPRRNNSQYSRPSGPGPTYNSPTTSSPHSFLTDHRLPAHKAQRSVLLRPGLDPGLAPERGSASRSSSRPMRADRLKQYRTPHH